MSFTRSAIIAAAASLGLSACAYDSYGHGYASVGYGGHQCDPYWDDCYGAYDPWYGWYDDYYYPGWGIYVYDQWRRPHRWNDRHRRYWESRRHRWGDRNWSDRRWERWDRWDRHDRRDWRDRRDRRRGDRRWRGRRGADNQWDGRTGTAVRAEAAPRTGEQMVRRELSRDWSGARAARPSRVLRGPEAERQPE